MDGVIVENARFLTRMVAGERERETGGGTYAVRPQVVAVRTLTTRPRRDGVANVAGGNGGA